MKREKSEVIQTIRQVMPSIVSIVVSKSLEALKRELPSANLQKNKKRPELHIPADKVDAHGMVQVGGGSGFIVDPSGIILTNKHVVNESDVEYSVIASDNEHYNAKILALDPVSDVAIMKISSREKLPTLELGDSTCIELGQTVLAFGNALGIFQNTVSKGIVSGLSRAVQAQADPDTPKQEMRGLIQTDAAINPGNSGGPLVDIFGRVIGINVAVVSGAHNISFAIPIAMAKHDLEDLRAHGCIRRPLLGVRYITLTKDIAEKLHAPVSYGAIIAREHSIDYAVAPNSPADNAGLDEHDIILMWNGKKLTEEKTIQDYLNESGVGDVIKLKILRKGREFEVTLTLTERK